MKSKIACFQGKYRFLSNFWPAAIWFQGRAFYSVEAAYQSAKRTSPEYKTELANTLSAGKAKAKGKNAERLPDGVNNWHKIKTDVMLELLRQKFNIPVLRYQLLATGDAELVEGNDWGDTFWGVSNKTGEGQNWLGKLLMQVRDEIRKEAEPSEPEPWVPDNGQYDYHP